MQESFLINLKAIKNECETNTANLLVVIEDLQQNVNTTLIEDLEKLVQEFNRTIADQEETNDHLIATTKKQQFSIKELKKTVEDQQRTVELQNSTNEEQQATIEELKITVRDHHQKIEQQNTTIEEQKATIEDLKETNRDHQLTINLHNATVGDQQERIARLAGTVRDQQNRIDALNKTDLREEVEILGFTVERQEQVIQEINDTRRTGKNSSPFCYLLHVPVGNNLNQVCLYDF